MRRPFLTWSGAWAQVVPALLRVAVRRARALTRRPAAAAGPVSLERSSASGTVSLSLGPTSPVRVDDQVVGTLTSVVELGTSTAETSSRLPDDPALLDAVVGLVLEGTTDLRRVAWFVPTEDAALRAAVASAGFACEGWAAPPLDDPRDHQLWARLTGVA